jgi:deoxyuridine 5''-triphosphate nucleotidohydrolase (dut)
MAEKKMNKAVLPVMLDKGAVMPTRAHATDAGLDVYAPATMAPVTIQVDGSATIDTGLHVAIPVGYVGLLKSKSGLNVRHGITSEGVIDAGYTGSVRVKLYNMSDALYTVRGGDKVSQLVVVPCITPEPMLVEALDATERGDKGFGSSGR